MKSVAGDPEARENLEVNGKRTFRNPWAHWIPVGIGLIALSVVTGWNSWNDRFLDHFENEIREGKLELARKQIDSLPSLVFRNPRGCMLMLTAFHRSGMPDRMERAAQGCIESGLRNPENYLGWALSRELAGDIRGAQQILKATAKRFPNIQSVQLASAKLERKLGHSNEAVIAYQRAFDLNPKNSTLAVEALRYFEELQRSHEAYAIAIRVQDVPNDDPEAHLLIAQALFRQGNLAAAILWVDRASTLLVDQPDLKKKLESVYPELLKRDLREPANMTSTLSPNRKTRRRS